MSATPAVRTLDAAPIDAARAAAAQARRDLFPFAFERWLLLGFVAFLSQCGRGGFGGTLPGLPGGGSPSGGGSGTGLDRWLDAHLALLATFAAAALALVLIVVLVVLWLNSRGVFAYVHCVATSRAELSAPWRLYGREADSFFRWQLALAGIVLAALLGMLAVGLLAALVGSRAGDGPGSALLVGAVVLLIPGFVLVMVAAGLASLALRDFVAPLQMANRTACRPAVILLARLIRAHPLAFFLYVVLKVVYGLFQGIVLLLAACLTCCCALIPVVTQTLLQPLFYFERAWPLHLLREMGYDVFTRPPSGEEAAARG